MFPWFYQICHQCTYFVCPANVCGHHGIAPFDADLFIIICKAHFKSCFTPFFTLCDQHLFQPLMLIGVKMVVLVLRDLVLPNLFSFISPDKPHLTLSSVQVSVFCLSCEPLKMPHYCIIVHVVIWYLSCLLFFFLLRQQVRN